MITTRAPDGANKLEKEIADNPGHTDDYDADDDDKDDDDDDDDPDDEFSGTHCGEKREE